MRILFVLILCQSVCAEVAVFDLEKSHVDKDAAHGEVSVSTNAVHGEAGMVKIGETGMIATHAPMISLHGYAPIKFTPTQPLVEVKAPEGMIKGSALFESNSIGHIHDIAFNFRLIDKDSAQVIADAITNVAANIGKPIEDTGTELKHWLIAACVALAVALGGWWYHVQGLKLKGYL